LLISPFYCNGFGAEMSAGEWAKFVLQHKQPKQAIGSLGIVLILYFLVSTALNLDFFWSDILMACICYFLYQFNTGKQALSS